jgi:signal transduction histidine kinase/ligand-binding sensor domain-containing protein
MKLLSKLLCFLIFFAGNSNLFSQTSLTSSEKYYLFKNYTTQNGLIDNVIHTVTQDKHGYLWFGSNLGLTRFDGKTFYHKAIPEIYKNSSFVKCLETTSEGNIVSTSFMQGVFVQQNDGRFKQYYQSGSFQLGKNIANSLKLCPDSSILVCEPINLFCLKNNSITEIYRSSDYRKFLTVDFDKDHRLWFGGEAGLGIMQFVDTIYEPVFFPEFEDIVVAKILFDKEGTLHVGTEDGYFRIKWHQPYTWNENYTIEQPFPEIEDLDINSLYLDKEQNLWILTAINGVFRTKGDSITLHLTQENGLLSPSVTCMIQDVEGNYWFGSLSGISMISNFDEYALSKNGNLFDEGRSFVSDSFHRIWINGKNSLYLYQNNELLPISLDGTPLKRVGIEYIMYYDSQIWLATSLGLYTIPVTKTFPDIRKLKKVVNFSSHDVDGVKKLIPDSDGIWICSYSKIFYYDKYKVIPVTFNRIDSTLLFPSNILRDKYGYYWVSNFNYGLYRGTISQPQKNVLLFDSIKAYKSIEADSAFVTAWIHNMCLDKEGNLWITSYHTGVYKLTLDSSGVSSYQLYSTANGLLSNDIQNIQCDDEGRIWLSSMKGFNILEFDNNGNLSINYLDKSKGFRGIGLQHLQINNKLALLTTEAIYVINNQFFKKKSEKVPKVLITNFLVNGVPNSAFSDPSRNIRLFHQQNNITLDFSAITFRNAEAVRYQYKLEGTGEDWSVLSERSFVEYASLRPGRYTFKVRAAMEGVEAGEETTLAFRILPAYYQTFWFYLIIVLMVFGLLYAFYKYRIRQVIKIERLRARIASDLHDDIGSTLSSISLLSEIASRQDKESALAKALSKIGDNSREVLNSMDDIIWSVNPQNDSLSSLIVRLREFAIPLCESKEILLHLNVEENTYTMKLGMDERRNVFLIAKEAINNAVKYSGCKNLTVTFVNNNELEIMIQDDGCGFDIALPTTRNGLVNMERRAEQIGANFIIKSEKNVGTLILVKIKNHINI